MKTADQISAEFDRRIADYQKLKKSRSTYMLEGEELAEVQMERQNIQDLISELDSMKRFVLGS